MLLFVYFACDARAMQSMQSKPGSRGTVLGLDLDETESVGGREPVLAAKLMDDDAGIIVRFNA